MSRLIYREPHPITREDASSAFESGDPARICDALINLAFHDPDWRWVEWTCLKFLDHSDLQVQALAAICLGHLARIHGLLHTELVVPRLEEMLDNPALGGSAEDALADIRTFIKRPARPDVRMIDAPMTPASAGPEQFQSSLGARVPAGWIVKESITVVSPDGAANVILSSEPAAADMDTRRYAELQGESLSAEFNNYRELSFGSRILLGGRPCFVRRFEWNAEGHEPVTQIQAYCVAGGRWYTTTATARSSDYPYVESILMTVLDSLSIDGLRAIER